MDNQRLFLYMALGFISLLLYQTWLADYAPAPVPAATSTVAPSTDASDASSVANVLPGVSAQQEQQATSDASLPPSSTPASVAGERISINTPLISAEILTSGGTIASVKLDEYPVSIDERDTPFTLMSDNPAQFLTAESGLLAGEGMEAHTDKSVYTVEQTEYTLSASAEEGAMLSVPLVWESNGIKVIKTFRFYNNKYEIDLDYQIENNSGKSLQVRQYYQLIRKPPGKGESSQFIRTYTGAVVSTEEEVYQKVDFDDIADENLSLTSNGGWVAMIQHYFAGAWIPVAESRNIFYTLYREGVNRYVVGMISPDFITVADGSSTTLGAKAFIGPKVQDYLKEAADHLELTVDFGWLTILAQPLFWLLKKIHSFVGNWGWAIILLTCLIKLFFYPLSQASYKSMARMKKLQPKLASLKERYGDDRAKMGQATMELYKKEKVNPLGGCLPMIVQIPVFIALYWMLLESVELRQAPWMFWIKDLAIKDPFYIMPVIMGITMFIQQKLNPAPVDPIQAKVFMFLPLVFTVFFAFFPAGLVLYWIVNNTLSIAQQYYITKHIIGDK